MSHTNLSAAEIALLELALPDIGGAIRGKPVTPDGDGWRVGSSTKISKNGRWFRLQGSARRLRRRLLHRALPSLHRPGGGRLGAELARPASSARPVRRRRRG